MKKIAIAAALVLSTSFAAQAADLVIDEPVSVADPILTSGLYFELLGGVALGGTLDHFYLGDFDHDHDLEAGWALAGVIGYEFGNGFAIELDALHTQRSEEGYDEGLSTTSLMGGVKYTVDVSDTIALYAGLGLGGIWTDDWNLDDTTSGFGYQIKAGVEVDVTENIALVGEYRFQNSFSELKGSDFPDYGNQAPVSAVLAGLKLSF